MYIVGAVRHGQCSGYIRLMYQKYLAAASKISMLWTQNILLISPSHSCKYMCLLWVDTEVTWFCFYSNCIKSITCIRKLQLASTQNIENIEKKIFFMNDEKVF